MPDVTIAELPVAASVNGTDLVPIFRDGQTFQATVSNVQLANTTPTYVTMGSEASLPNERVLTAGSGITIVDNGAGSTAVVQIGTNPVIPGNQRINIPVGTTGQRPGGTLGDFRGNSTINQLEWYDGSTWNPLASSVSVSSVGLSLPAEFTVSNSPVTSSGTLTGTWASATQNYVFAAPSGSSGTPGFRALVASDIPALSYIGTTLASTNIIVGNGSNVATAVAMSGDATLANTGAITVSKFGGTSFGSMAGQSASAVAITGGTATLSDLHCGDVGTEGGGININGVTYQSTLKVSDIDGTNFAQTILHRHSTTLEPLIVGARSNSDTSAHASVVNGQTVFGTYGAGWAGSNYKLFGSLTVGSDATGTISNTSAPGRWILSVTPDGSVNPVAAITVSNSGAVAFASATATLNGVQILTTTGSGASLTGITASQVGATSSTLTSANIYVGNGSNVATAVAVTGDVTISNAGVTAIGANKVTVGMLAQAAGSTILGNVSTSTGNVAALTDAQAATVLARYLELAPSWYR